MKFAVWCNMCGGFEGGSTDRSDVVWYTYHGAPVEIKDGSKILEGGMVFGLDSKHFYYNHVAKDGGPNNAFYKYMMGLNELALILQNSLPAQVD